MGIFSTIGHFFFGGPSTSKSKTSGTSTTTPYGPAEPYVKDYLANTANLYGPNGAPQFSPLEQSGIDALTNVTNAGTPGLDAAYSANTDVASGKYLSPDTNPYLADIAKRVSGMTMSNINSTFGGAGRTGSGLDYYDSAKGVGDSLTDFYGSEYDKERALQQQAIGQAPQLEAGRYLAPQALLSEGQSVSARPFDINAQYGGILGNIAKLGQTTNASSTGNTTGRSESNGWILNKLFPS